MLNDRYVLLSETLLAPWAGGVRPSHPIHSCGWEGIRACGITDGRTVRTMADAARMPTAFEKAVEQVIVETLAPWGADAAEVKTVWVAGAGMWFTEVHPRNPRAAPLVVGVQDDDEFNVTVAHTWLEFLDKEDPLGWLRLLSDAVFAGKVEEVGFRATSAARVDTAAGRLSFGAVQLPWPWRWRHKRRYQPYR